MHTPNTSPAVLARVTFKDSDALASLSADVVARLSAWVRYDEYLTVEFLTDGTARVVPTPAEADDK